MSPPPRRTRGRRDWAHRTRRGRSNRCCDAGQLRVPFRTASAALTTTLTTPIVETSTGLRQSAQRRSRRRSAPAPPSPLRSRSARRVPRRLPIPRAARPTVAEATRSPRENRIDRPRAWIIRRGEGPTTLRRFLRFGTTSLQVRRSLPACDPSLPYWLSRLPGPWPRVARTSRTAGHNRTARPRRPALSSPQRTRRTRRTRTPTRVSSSAETSRRAGPHARAAEEARGD